MGDTETYGLQNSSVMRKRPDGQRIGLAADWAALNPILERGEIGVTSDTNVLKVGDGTTRWSSLTGISGGGGGAVSSVDGQTGAVTLSGSYGPGGTAGNAPLASPAFTGNPTAPTPTAGDNDTSIATTAFVQGAVSGNAPAAKSANYTLAAADTLILGTGGASGITLTLPSSPVTTRPYRAKKVDAGIGAVVVAPPSGTIDGAASFSIGTRYQSQDFIYDGTTWWAV